MEHMGVGWRGNKEATRWPTSGVRRASFTTDSISQVREAVKQVAGRIVPGLEEGPSGKNWRERASGLVFLWPVGDGEVKTPQKH